jgi:hypothetical protein
LTIDVRVACVREANVVLCRVARACIARVGRRTLSAIIAGAARARIASVGRRISASTIAGVARDDGTVGSSIACGIDEPICIPRVVLACETACSGGSGGVGSAAHGTVARPMDATAATGASAIQRLDTVRRAGFRESSPNLTVRVLPAHWIVAGAGEEGAQGSDDDDADMTEPHVLTPLVSRLDHPWNESPSSRRLIAYKAG